VVERISYVPRISTATNADARVQHSVTVEQAIYGDLRVGEVAAVAVPDKRLGELVTVVVVPKEGKDIKEEEILAVCKQSLPHFAVPVMVLVQKDPLRKWFHKKRLHNVLIILYSARNAGGKVLKPDLRKVAATAWARRNSKKAKAKL